MGPPFVPPFLVPTATLKKNKSLKHSLRKLTKKYKGMPPMIPPGYMMMPPPGPQGPPFFGPPPPHHAAYGPPPPPGSTLDPRRHRPPPQHMNGYAPEDVPPMRPVTPLSHMYGRLASYDPAQQEPPQEVRPRDKGKKGHGLHMNERAFLHSIRQEQRSRSGSVATIDRKSTHSGTIEVETHERRANGDINGHSASDMARSMESLHLNGSANGVIPSGALNGAKSKTASIKRGSSQNGLKVGIPVPPPPLPTLVNGNRKK